MKTLKLSFLCSAVWLLISSCENSIIFVDLRNDTIIEEEPDQADNPTDADGKKIYIIDRTGKRWDVTHAVSHYGFDPGKFQFGLGPDAIKPILDPQMLCPGEVGYPEGQDVSLVLGTSIDEHTRAYPLSIMSAYEVADEQFDDIFVAVAY